MARLLRKLLGRKEPEPGPAPPVEPPLRELGELPHVEPAALDADAAPEGREVLAALRAQKLVGLRERAERVAREQQRAAEDAARTDAAERDRRSMEEARDRLLAQRAFNALPELIRKAASLGLDAAILSDAFVDGKGDEGPSARSVAIDGREHRLTGWLVPFMALCEEAGVPLTVISERVDIDAAGKHQRVFHVLAVDLAKL